MLRGLKTSDIFKMSKILKKMNLKVEATYTQKDETGKEFEKLKGTEQFGAELILKIFENIHLAEIQLNEFLADMSGMKPEEFAELPIEKTLEIVKEFKQIPGLSNFLKLANQ